MKDILLIDKPEGWTSFDVVAKVRGKIRREYITNGVKPTKKQLKVGHAGTLDPFATGLLILLLGDACKRAGDFLKLDKSYEFIAKLGEVSSTGDPEGEILEYEKWNRENGTFDSSHTELVSESISKSTPSVDEVEKVLQQFTGNITQTPPAYSAIKIDGKRAYKLAREGKEVEIPSRPVTIYSLELISYKYPNLKARCKVSSGTYIRSLVEDIGKALNTGAYCTELRRTQTGDYSIVDAQNIDTNT